jgi:hypothetical protein
MPVRTPVGKMNLIHDSLFPSLLKICSNDSEAAATTHAQFGETTRPFGE